MRGRSNVIIPDALEEELPSKMPPEIARILRLHLERLASRLDRVQASHVYMSAFRRAAKMVRESKPD